MTRATPLPEWKDEAGVAAFVDKFIAQERAIKQCFLDFIGQTHRRPRLGQDPEDDVIWFLREERTAVDAAKRGELAALIELLRDPHRDWLQPETVELVIEFMTGMRNPRTGRRRGEGKVGRGRMTEEEREAWNPLYNAAAEFGAIKRLLREHYPSQPFSEIRERALELAAEGASVEPERLSDYLNRARGVRRDRGQPFLAKHSSWKNRPLIHLIRRRCNFYSSPYVGCVHSHGADSRARAFPTSPLSPPAFRADPSSEDL